MFRKYTMAVAVALLLSHLSGHWRGRCGVQKIRSE